MGSMDDRRDNGKGSAKGWGKGWGKGWPLVPLLRSLLGAGQSAKLGTRVNLQGLQFA